MRIDIRSWPDPAAFIAHLGAVDESKGHVVHGVAHMWLDRPENFRPGTPLLTAEADGAAVAAALQASQGKVVFSDGPRDAVLALADWLEAESRRPLAAVAPEEAVAGLLTRWPGTRGLETTFYRIDTAPAPTAAPGSLRLARSDETELLTRWVAAFNLEAGLPHEPKPRRLVDAKLAAGHLFVWDHDGPRALAALAGPTPRAVRINSVYTPEAHRGHGYASAAVARLAGQELAAGRAMVTLFADRALPHTNRMYRKIGFQPLADFADLELSAT
jgi:predicted GNAT family acetyltransferase